MTTHRKIETKIAVTTYVVMVMHPSDLVFEGLEHAMEEADTGHAVGDIIAISTTAVPDDNVPNLLRVLGNDGTFFDDDLEREEE